MQIQDLEKFNLPEAPGVYFFCSTPLPVGERLGEGQNKILYIGKATSLKDRVKSYFSNDILHTRGLHIANMISLADKVEFQTTRSVLEALLLENELIKKYKPLYNTKEKDDKSYWTICITKEDFPRVLLVRNKNILANENGDLCFKLKNFSHIKKKEDNVLSKVEKGALPFGEGSEQRERAGVVLIGKTFGPYPSGEYAKEALKVVRKIFPFRDKCEVFDKEKPWQKKPCFSYQIGLCPGPCAGVISKKEYAKQINRLSEFLSGNGEELRKKLEKEMQEYSNKQEFENAQKIKDMIFALEHIRDAHLIKKENDSNKNFRIEAFDISHISGSNRVGAMTVVLGSVTAKHEYKKFKISTDKNDDLEGLKELLERRFKHLEWGIPDLIVLDGDERHIKVAEKVARHPEKILSEAKNLSKDPGKLELDSSIKNSSEQKEFFPQNDKTQNDNLQNNNLQNDKIFDNLKIVAVTKDKTHKANSIIGNQNISEEEIKKYKDEIILANSEVHRFALKYHRELRSKDLKLKK
jgi:excinuclease ABC subunit C